MTVDGSSRIHAPAKLNLNLRVTGRRGDGYHLLDSIVVFTDFGDRIGPGRRNGQCDPGRAVCRRARYRRGQYLPSRPRRLQAGGKAGGFAISIDKQIPVGAGLGGGSSDAAAILRHLNSRSPALPAPRLAEAALSLGADVPVCLCGTAQRMRGIGDVLTPVDPAPRIWSWQWRTRSCPCRRIPDIARTGRGRGGAVAEHRDHGAPCRCCRCRQRPSAGRHVAVLGHRPGPDGITCLRERGRGPDVGKRRRLFRPVCAGRSCRGGGGAAVENRHLGCCYAVLRGVLPGRPKRLPARRPGGPGDERTN